MPEVLVTPATTTPISLDEAKLFLRVTHNKEDSEIQALVEDATRFLEDRLGQQFLTASWILTQPCFNDNCILLPRPPLQSVQSVSYVDTNGTTQTLSASLYQVDIKSMPGRIMPAYNEWWPDLRTETFNPVTIAYTAGYTTAALVPPAIKRAIKFIVGHWYSSREPVVIGSISGELELTLEALLASVWHGAYVGLR